MINFDADYRLQNKAVLLRPLRQSDFKHLLPYALNEPETWQFSLMQAIGEQGLKQYIAQALQARVLHKEYPFIVFDKQQQKYAGSTRFYDIQPFNKMMQLGFTWYGKQFRGTKLNKQCKFLLFQFAFDTLQMERIELRADVDNQISIAALKSIGCTTEGILRSHATKPDGNRRSSVVVSILKHEWETTVKQALLNKINTI